MMRYAPYLLKHDFSFSDDGMSRLTLGFSNDALELVAGSHLDLQVPGVSGTVTCPIQLAERSVSFFELPANTAIPAPVVCEFSNGSSLTTKLDVLYSTFLKSFGILCKPYLRDGQTLLGCLVSWQVNPLLINRLGSYSFTTRDVGTETLSHLEDGWAIEGLEPGEVFPITLTAIDYNGVALGSISFNVYVPQLEVIPTQSEESNVGYTKRVDPSGIEETYNINHNKTLGQLTTAVQGHGQETRSLADHLPSIDPATVIAAKANEYVQSFDVEKYNSPFNYSDAKTAAANTAPDATASLNQEHQGNYTLKHQGTLNQTTTTKNFGGMASAPVIHTKSGEVNEERSGKTRSRTMQNYYEQNQQEQLRRNTHKLTSPQYTENINNLDASFGQSTINADDIHFEGNLLNFNGEMITFGDHFMIGPPIGSTRPLAFEQTLKQPSSCEHFPPTPIPEVFLGKCQYYQWRNQNFITRHLRCDHSNPPEYYLQYGLVFCRLFSNELAAKMDADGKGWIDRTRLNLQLDMEAFLKENPTCELNNHEFYKLAFQSHQKAYLDAGFLNLSGRDAVEFLDIYQFLETLSQQNYVGHLARAQTGDLMIMYLDAHSNDKYGLYFLKVLEEGGYLAEVWGESFVESIGGAI